MCQYLLAKEVTPSDNTSTDDDCTDNNKVSNTVVNAITAQIVHTMATNPSITINGTLLRTLSTRIIYVL